MGVTLNNEELQFLRTKLKQGEYNGVDIMHAWLAIDELIDLRNFVGIALEVHPNLDMDVDSFRT